MSNIKIYSSSELINKLSCMDEEQLKDKRLLNVLFKKDKHKKNEEYKKKQITNNILKVILMYINILLGVKVEKVIEINMDIMLKNKRKNRGLYDYRNHMIILMILEFLNDCGLTKINNIFTKFILKIIEIDEDLMMDNDIVKISNICNQYKKSEDESEEESEDESEEESEDECEKKRKEDKIREIKRKEEKANEEKLREEKVEEDVLPVNVLKYNHNSCYMDSVLLAILFNNNKIINEYIIEKDVNSIDPKSFNLIDCKFNNDQEEFKFRKDIQKELNTIKRYIEIGGGILEYNIKNLRKILSRCFSTRTYSTKRQQDSHEFLSVLFKLFDFNILPEEKSKFYSVDNKTWTQGINVERTVNNPIIMLNPDTIREEKLSENTLKQMINKKEISYLSDGFVGEDGVKYKYKYEETKYDLSKNYLVIVINRKKFDNSFSNKKVVMPEKIDSLILRSIVIHNGTGHYTSYLRSDENKWYYYNDMDLNIKYVGNYEFIVSDENKKKKPSKNGTIYFYN